MVCTLSVQGPLAGDMAWYASCHKAWPVPYPPLPLPLSETHTRPPSLPPSLAPPQLPTHTLPPSHSPHTDPPLPSFPPHPTHLLQSELVWDRTVDSKALLGWEGAGGRPRLVVAFKGTSSRENVITDLKVGWWRAGVGVAE